MKYRRKTPEAIEAIQWKGDNKLETFEFLGWYYWSKIEDVARGGKFHYYGPEGLNIGPINVKIGDYIVKDNDEFIVYTEDIFNETFELTFQNSTPIGIDLPPIHTDPNDLVPFHTMCSCNPIRGGFGGCGCTMANKLVPRNQSTFTTSTTGKVLLNDQNSSLYTISNT